MCIWHHYNVTANNIFFQDTLTKSIHHQRDEQHSIWHSTNEEIFKLILVLMAEVCLVKLPSDEFHWTLLRRTYYWEANKSTKPLPEPILTENFLCQHMAPLGHNEWRQEPAQFTHDQYHVFWWPGSLRRHVISRYGTDLANKQYSLAWMEQVNLSKGSASPWLIVESLLINELICFT